MKKQCRTCPRKAKTLYRGQCRQCHHAEIEAKIGPGVRVWHPTSAADEVIVDGLIRTRRERLRPANWCPDDSRETELKKRQEMGLLKEDGECWG